MKARKEKPQPTLPTIKLPAGFKIVASGDFAKSHDFLKVSEVQGKPEGIRDVKVKGKATRVMTILKPGGDRAAIWESVQLKNLFDEVAVKLSKKKECTVFIRFEGKQKIKGQKIPMKLFTAGIS